MARKQSTRRRHLKEEQTAEREMQAQSRSRVHNATGIAKSAPSLAADHSSSDRTSLAFSFEWLVCLGRHLIFAHWIGCAIAIAMLEHVVMRTITFSYSQDLVKLTLSLPTALLPSLVKRLSEIFWPDGVMQLLSSWMHADLLRCDARPFHDAPHAPSATLLSSREQSLLALFRMYLRDHPSRYDAPVLFAALMIDKVLMATLLEGCLLLMGWTMLWLTDVYVWFFTPFLQYFHVKALEYQQRQQHEGQRQQKYHDHHHHHHHFHRYHTHSYAYRDARTTACHLAIDTTLYKQTICVAQQFIYCSIACTTLYYTVQAIELHVDAMHYDGFFASSEQCLPIYAKLNRLSQWRLVSSLMLMLFHAVVALVALIRLCILLSTGFSLSSPSPTTQASEQERDA